MSFIFENGIIKYMTPAQKMAELKKVAWNVSKLIGPLHSLYFVL